MHPILARAERLTTYLAAWLIVAVLLAAVLTRQGLSWLEALALLLPMCLIYGFACLSAWYVCRATPLATSGVHASCIVGSRRVMRADCGSN
jgi:Sec-independent protein secretion pathway component TatC